MSVINTNISSAIGMNMMRINNIAAAKSVERLSSGLQINHASDDPSGLAISKGMEGQIRSIRTAVQNSEDTINLIHTADGALSETHDILLRMRDISVRAANEAPLTPEDNQKLQNEFSSLVEELTRKAQAVTFNTKQLLNGQFNAGHVAQIGPDNGAQYRELINIIQSDAAALTVDPFPGAGVSVDTPSSAQSAIDSVNNAIELVSDIRSNLGIKENIIRHSIADLMAEDVNISAAKSRIYDADMAREIVDMTRTQILTQSSTAILAQSNAQPQSMLQLLK